MYILFLVIVINFSCSESSLRIIGGRNAHKDEFPFVIRLEEVVFNGKKKYYWPVCTGAALNSEWILSAAHCFFNERNERIETAKFIVRYNSFFPRHQGETSLVVDVKINPSYDGLKYDISLARTEQIVVARYGKISAVDYTTLVGHEASSLGFGGTNATPNERPLQVLQGMLNYCLKKDEPGIFMLCVLPSCAVKATICGGDSGGPVVHHSGIVGVNAMSIDDCDENTEQLHITSGTSASIIATVSPLIDWISNTITNKI